MAHPQLRGRQWEAIKAHHRALGQPCHLCGYPINTEIPWPSPLSFAVDHLIARSDGGTNAIENTAPIHMACNTAKRERVVTPELRASCRQMIERLNAVPVRHVDTSVDWYSP